MPTTTRPAAPAGELARWLPDKIHLTLFAQGRSDPGAGDEELARWLPDKIQLALFARGSGTGREFQPRGEHDQMSKSGPGVKRCAP